MAATIFEKTAVATAGAVALVTFSLVAGSRTVSQPVQPDAGQLAYFIAEGDPRTGYVRADMNALGLEMALHARRDPLWRDTIVYLTCLHELGHALGLAHTADFRDIMYFFGYGGDIVEYFSRYRRQLTSRGDIASASGLSDSDIARLRELRAGR